MSYRRALLASLGPALLVAPLLGVAGFGAIMLAVTILGGSADEGGVLAATGGAFALVLGLVVAGPLCLLGASVLLWLGARRPAWRAPRRWIAAGTLGGAGAVTGLWLLAEAPASEGWPVLAALTALGAGLGALGAWACHRLLRRRMAELETIDPAVFA